MRTALLALAVIACAPIVDGPGERQRATDRSDSERLTAQLATLPGVVRADVIVRRAVRDPLSTAPASAPGASVVVIADDGADRATLERTVRDLTRVVVPDLEPVVVVTVGSTRPQLSSVGPFTVESGSRQPLKAALAISLAVIAALAAWIAWRERASRGARPTR